MRRHQNIPESTPSAEIKMDYSWNLHSRTDNLFSRARTLTEIVRDAIVRSAERWRETVSGDTRACSHRRPGVTAAVGDDPPASCPTKPLSNRPPLFYTQRGARVCTTNKRRALCLCWVIADGGCSVLLLSPSSRVVGFPGQPCS